MVELAKYSIILFSIVMFSGGLVGFTKAKSKASLIAGTVSAFLLITSFWISVVNLKAGLITACIVLALLVIVFLIRLFKTKKFMPSGMLFVLCLAEGALLLFALSSRQTLF